MKICIPEVLSIDERTTTKHLIRRMCSGRQWLQGNLAAYSKGTLAASVFEQEGTTVSILIVPPKAKLIPESFVHVLQAVFDPTKSESDLSDAVWLRHPSLDAESKKDRKELIQGIQDSWIGGFSYTKEDVPRNISGLRGPQIGALHAIHAHWSVSREVATIVLPTGVGKTETMLSILLTAPCERLLVVVPTDALRTQIADKFVSLGILKNEGLSILKTSVERPLVCSLQHIPTSVSEVDDLLPKAQVFVTTSAIAGQCSKEVRDRLAEKVPYLFIDEAHHAEAPTWKTFKGGFSASRVVQFTATPFREDDKPLDGRIVFKYSLKQAQLDGYFKPIHFDPVTDFDQSAGDRKIAEKAVACLRRDFAKGHVVMARVATVARAKEVYALYEQYPEFNPVQLHTGLTLKQQSEGRKTILAGESRIVVCVDMLGEGFDLPELKIAAFHDIRKSLAVTLQLAGRFTRTRPDLGEATFIANDADVNVRDELRKLYSKDPDWNVLLPDMAEKITGEQASLQELVRGFTAFPEEIALNVVRPATSAVVYRTTCSEWHPEDFRKGIPGADSCEQLHHAINAELNLLVIVAVRRVGLKWTDADNLFGWEWELYVVVWSQDQNLLYINGSTNAGDYKALAHAVTRDKATHVKGQNIFRVFNGIKRLRFHNAGVSEHIGRNVRYTGRMGSDVEPVMTQIQKGKAQKSVLDGSGYEGGAMSTMGASRKGRVWSHQRANLEQFIVWCKKVGSKLIDSTIDADEVLKGTLSSVSISQRPAKMPINIDWPETIYTEPERDWVIGWGAKEYSLSELSINLVLPSSTTPLRFAISSESTGVELELEIFVDSVGDPNYRFLLRGDEPVSIKHGAAAQPRAIVDFFERDPPTIWFADGSSLEGNEYIELKTSQPPYDARQIVIWDWTGTDLSRESQGLQRLATSIQARTIRELLKSDDDVIVDDDSSGEAADIVCVKIVGGIDAPAGLDVRFFHCKYSHGAQPGARVADLYEVCGQAQKSIWWASTPEKKTDLFTHLMRRESARIAKGDASRIERGSLDLLKKIREISRIYPVTFSISIVQPGISAGGVSNDQLQLLGVTENHLWEMFQIKFDVIASA
jgi:superfamily II DNA or RNA helicase